MGTTLENGVYLPSEGERNCYAGLKTNWEILDQKVADVTALQQAVAGALHREIVESLPTTDIDPNTIYMILSGTSATENVYNEYMYVNNAWELIGTSATDLTNYYTKAEVDGKLLLKASASDLTSHTGDTTIHVTASDKNKWNNQTFVFRYSSTALTPSSTNSNALLDNTDNLKVGDKVIDSSGVLFSITAIDTQNSTFTIGTALIDLAQDSDVVHKSGDETVGGIKTFNNVVPINGAYLGNEPSSSFRTVLLLRSRYDTAGKSGWLVSKFRSNSAQGALGGSDTVFLNFDVLENEVRTNGILRFNLSSWSGNTPGRFSLIPNSAIESYLGTSGNKWAAINGLNPSSLGMPDLDNGIDISSYIDVSQTSQYTAPADGYISICGYASANNAILIKDHDYDFAMTTRAISTSLGATTYLIIPVVKNHVYDITCNVVTTINYAKFYPCQGNV